MYCMLAARRTVEKDPEVVWSQQNECVDRLVMSAVALMGAECYACHSSRPLKLFSVSVDILRTF